MAGRSMVGHMALTHDMEVRSLPGQPNAGSSSGRIPGLDPGDGGPNPPPAARKEILC